MDIKSCKFYTIIFLISLFLGCAKVKHSKLAQNYYKTALVELQEQRNDKQYSFKRALDYIEKSIELEGKPEYVALKGTILFELGYQDAGQSFLDIALSKTKDPKLKCEILNNKACLLAQVGLYNKDYSKINKALSVWQGLEKNKDYLTPEVALFNQSKIFVFQNNYNMAKSKLEKAIRLSPNYLDAHYYLALINYELLDYKSVKNEIDLVLFLYPEHKGAQNLRKIMQNM